MIFLGDLSWHGEKAMIGLRRVWAKATFSKPNTYGKFQRLELGGPTVGGRVHVEEPWVELDVGS